jgi:acetyl-CoA C-acetyltransferase
MTLDPRTPVLVGAGTAMQRFDDPNDAKEAAALMAEAAEAAARDAGDSDLLRDAKLFLTPKGTWRYHDASRVVARHVGNTTARTVIAELGILQTTLFSRAAAAIAAGDVDIAIVVGGEAKFRDLRAAITGISVHDIDDTGALPDEVVHPHGHIIGPVEIQAGLVNAVSHYTQIENALRAAEGQSLDDHARLVAALWARFNVVARDNPDAWNRAPMTAEDIATPGPRNRPLAFPYNKWHNSQWNVDQAAAFVLCSVETARARNLSTDLFVFPQVIVESNHMVPVSARAEVHRSQGFAIAGRAAFASAGVGVDDIAHVDLSSCFPVAVRVQAAELGLSVERPLTVTGGMTFAGGPLNNYVLQSTAKMTRVLRDDPGALGLVTAISGMITKQGVSIWSTNPLAGGYRGVDVSDEVAAATPTVSVVDPTSAGERDASVVTYTVLFDERQPARGVVVASLDDDDGTRAIAQSTDPAITNAMTQREWCGQRIRLDGAGGFSVA